MQAKKPCASMQRQTCFFVFTVAFFSNLFPVKGAFASCTRVYDRPLHYFDNLCASTPYQKLKYQESVLWQRIPGTVYRIPILLSRHTTLLSNKRMPCDTLECPHKFLFSCLYRYILQYYFVCITVQIDHDL